ncbi:MAG: hypothetical protein ACR2LC_12760 [Pyrinomonadaceae bacterium]
MGMLFSAEDEIAQVKMQRPHVVVLGAGASIQAFPNGDKNGKKLPSMLNFVDVLDLSSMLDNAGVPHKGRNFEDIYDQIHNNAKLVNLKQKLEDAVYDYFSSLEIKDEPTIYDHLVLSLRSKGVIATFNWDPFLVQALRRNGMNGRGFKLPRLQFLHGNVMIGFCHRDKVTGVLGAACSHCGQRFIPSKLLYPIGKKNYHLDNFISEQWSDLHNQMQNAFMITVFGYGAPKSDISAIDLMKTAWGDVNSRYMEQTEIIDIREEDDLRETWKPFIHTHHYEVHDNFYDSWIANHPRRTGEAYINQYVDAMFIDNNPVPKDLDFPELWDWFEKLHEVEDKQSP